MMLYAALSAVDKVFMSFGTRTPVTSVVGGSWLIVMYGQMAIHSD